MAKRLYLALFGACIAFFGAAPVTRAADTIEATVEVCAGCHGANGVPTDPKTIPIIWGQQQSYLMKQLRNYRNGERDNPIMAPVAKGLAEEDLRKIAAYFAATPWPAPKRADAAPARLPKGAAQCQPCHQPKFEGGMPAPRLAGLSSNYLAAQMSAFAAHKRNNNLDMPGFMRMLTPKQRTAIARYLSAL